MKNSMMTLMTMVVVMMAIVTTVRAVANNVTLVLLEESMCPDCQDFMNEELVPTLQAKGVAEILTIEIIPWGNAYFETSECPTKTPGKFDGKACRCWMSTCAAPNASVTDCFGPGQAVCQHGENECLGDRISACVIDMVPVNSPQVTSFEICFVGKNEGDLTAAQGCVESVGLKFEDVMGCAKGSRGDVLERIAAVNTLKADARHQGVPWAIIDGQVVQNNILSAICQAYKGPRPEGCPN